MSYLFSCLMILSVAATALAGDEPVLAQFESRVVGLREDMPEITRAARRVATRWVGRLKGGKPTSLSVKFGPEGSFGSELTSRAGGLINTHAVTYRIRMKQETAGDVLLIAVRSWEQTEDYWRDVLETYRKEGWLVIAFASGAGRPADLPIDILIDNHAPDGSAGHARANGAVNVAAAWVFKCELVAALTALGRRPPILKCGILPGAAEHNGSLGHGTFHARLEKADKTIAAGLLGVAYLDAVDAALLRLKSDAMTRRIDAAAEIAASRVRAGHRLWASSFTHLLDGQMLKDNIAPITGLYGVRSGGHDGKGFREALSEGDLMIWFGEWTLNGGGRDYIGYIREAGADVIASYRPPKEGETLLLDAEEPEPEELLMVIGQDWPYEGAVVPIPFAPGHMAPITGVESLLLYRTLDEAIAAKLE